MFENQNIGRSGRFVVIEPYNTLVKENVVYTINGTLFLREHLRNGLDVFMTTYNILGIDKSVYDADVRDNVIIVTLTDSAGKTIYLPERAVTGCALRDGVTYGEKSLIVNLGAFPLSKDFTDLLNDFKLFLKSRLGVSPSIELVKSSIDTSITNVEHDGIESSRVIDAPDNADVLYRNALAEIVILKQTIVNLECIIKEKVEM